MKRAPFYTWLLITMAMVASIQSSLAQPSDFIILTKKGRTIQSWYPSNNIQFYTKRGVYVDAQIVQIKNDSLFLRQYLVRQVMTSLGYYIIDTAGSLRIQYAFSDIGSLNKESKNFNWNASAGTLVGGGLLLSLASGVVYLADRDKFSPGLLLGGLGAATTGYLIAKLSTNRTKLGKKLQLKYISLAGSATKP